MQCYNYCQEGIYFITICTHNRQNLFGEFINGELVLNVFGEIVRDCWSSISEHASFICVDDYSVVMPNHFHGILEIDMNAGRSISSVVGSFKSAATKRIREEMRRLRRASTLQLSHKIWQSGFYEHIVRNEKDLFLTREYIQNNPMDWNQDPYNEKPVKTPAAHRYQGEMR